MNRSFVSAVSGERSIANKKSRRRRLRLEQFENRVLMAADSSIDNLVPLNADWETSSAWVDTDSQNDSENEKLDPYFPDHRLPSEIEEETSWVLRLDAESLSELFALSTPAILGEFTPASLTYTTLANGMPILNSLLGSPTSVFLDFDGDTTTATDPYDVDGNPTSFNVTEQKQIAEAWRHLATYFAMFDTDVTTIQPATAQPKVWASIGNNISGGYCYVNTFPNNTPRCFNQSGDARTRQSGIAHEVGHNFGLQHQSDFDLFGTETADYSSGYDQLHVPIMGVDFAQRVRKFVIGHTVNASALQDDVNVIRNKIIPYQATGGDGFRADDVGGTIATAVALTSLNDVQYATGIIERLNDVDAYSFISNGQTITVSALADFPSGVDLKLEVYDALGVLVAAKDAPTLNDQEITLVLPTGTYYAMVSSHGNYGDLGTYNLAVRSLPTGWKSGDIGTTGITGFSQFHSSTNSYVLGASGADIGGTTDEMQFARQTLTGDGTIIAQVTSLINTDGNAKAGIEIRETTAGNSKHVSLTATATQGVKFIRRTTVGGSSTTTSGTVAAFTPVWLRLQRVGNVITASTSANGTTWTTLGSPATVAMNATVQIGLVATARNDRLYTAAEFENVSITGNLGDSVPTPNSLPAPTGLTVTRATGADLNISWDNQENETGYRIERSIDGAIFTTAGTTAADLTTFVDTGLVGTMRYFYRVLTLDASGASIPSAVVSELNRPSAVGNLELTSYSATQIVLDWIDTSGETGYRIERSTDGVAYTTIGSVGVNIPSYTASSLTTGTTYFFRVTPTSAFGDGPSTVLSSGTRMAQVTNLAFTSVTGNSISLSWTDLTTETGYQVQRSTDGMTFSTLTTLAAGVVAYTDTTVTPGNEYYYRVLGTSGQSVSLYNLAFTATPTVTALPIPWSAQDIGTASGGTGSSRSTTFNSTDSSFKVVSSGSTISGTSDSFRFTHQTLTGDGVVTARVTALEDTAAGSTRFGVMFREALNAGSRYAAMLLRKDNSTAQFSVRTTAGIAATTTSDAVRNTPYWVRVSRAGNVFTGFTSSDGVTWTQIGQSTIAMPATVFVGLAASAGTTSLLNTATATNVSVVANPVLAVTSGSRVYNDTAYVATASMANNTLPAPTVSFVYYSDPAGTTVIPAPVKVGTYYVRAVSAANAGNNAAQSPISSFQITPFGLTVSATGQHKIYNGTTVASVVFSDNRFVGDVFTVSGTASFSSKDIGVAKAVSVINVSLSGVDALNYSFNTTAATTADINPKTLDATSTAANKVYDGNENASVTISLAGIIAGETVTGSASGLFNDKNAGTGKTVTTGTVTLAGAGVGNYTVGAASATTANITPFELTVSATGQHKIYDGSTVADVVLSDNRIAGDVFTVGATAAFGNKDVGVAKAISVSNVALSGVDATNYSFNTSTTAIADINPKALVATGTSSNKIYEGNANASVTISLDGVVVGDDLNGTATATFADKNVGAGKLVTIGAVTLVGVDNDNYTVGSAPDTTADITAKPIVGTITAANKVFDGTDAATILTRTLSGVIGAEIVEYVGGTATFDSASAGDGKTVTATGLSLSGPDAGNYLVNTTATTTANIEANSAPTEVSISNNLIAENAGSDAVVGTLSFTDPNVGDTAVFSLPTGVLDNGLFNIATDGITLRANSSSDFEALNAYSVTVRVTDAGGLSFDKVLSIGVTDVNEAPTDISLSATTVAENLPNGTDVGNFSTNDPDSGNTFTYVLVPVQGNSDDTSFTIVGNTLKTAAVLDFEAKPSYSIRVRSTDQGGLTKENDFTINVVADTNVPTRDFGDAPLPYPASGGHLAVGPQLGATRDVEAGIQRSAAADGDGSDEDGVLFGIINTALGQAGVNIDLQNATTGRVDGWIDFNGDGDWSDVGEQIFANTSVIGGIQTLNYTIPADAVAGQTIARIRVSSNGALTPIEPASDGEVEDYRVTIGSTPSAVVQKAVNNANVTRSELTSITVDFDSVVPVQASDFILQNTTTNQTVTGIDVQTQSIDGTTRATLTFTSGPSVTASTHASVPPSLANGAYTLRYLPTETPGNTTPIDEFFRKFGDADGNNLITLTDFAIFRSAFGSSVGGANYRADMDSNRDGAISLTDFAAFRSGFGS